MSKTSVILTDNRSGRPVEMPILEPTHGDAVVDIGAAA